MKLNIYSAFTHIKQKIEDTDGAGVREFRKSIDLNEKKRIAEELIAISNDKSFIQLKVSIES